jgi:hypothetical protein
MGRKALAVRLVTLGLAFAHLFPAKKHLALFVAHPSLGDGWRGFGALMAIALYLLPPTTQARLLVGLWTRARTTLRIAGLVLAAAHAGAALEYLPHLRHTLAWSDAWRGIGASIAVTWFVLDVRLQARVLSRLQTLALAAPSPRAWAFRLIGAAVAAAAIGVAACATAPLGDTAGGDAADAANPACKPYPLLP